ncbi:MAG: FkbM family methyltransferase [Terrimicrobiaceae bacterium]
MKAEAGAADHILGSTFKIDNLINAIPEAPKVVFDVGANCGLFSGMLLNSFPEAKVFAFEPNADLQHAFLFNTNGRAFLEISGISDCEEELTFYKTQGSQTSTFVNGSDYLRDNKLVGEYKVRVTTLDAFCSKHSIDSIDVLKIDVQGLERKVLAGGGKILKTVSSLLIESSWSFPDTVFLVSDLINSYGFTNIYVLNNVFTGADLLLRRSFSDKVKSPIAKYSSQ